MWFNFFALILPFFIGNFPTSFLFEWKQIKKFLVESVQSVIYTGVISQPDDQSSREYKVVNGIWKQPYVSSVYYEKIGGKIKNSATIFLGCLNFFLQQDCTFFFNQSSNSIFYYQQTGPGITKARFRIWETKYKKKICKILWSEGGGDGRWGSK